MAKDIEELFNMIVGNDHIKDQLIISIAASKAQNRALPHVLFAGAAGCGKTTMSKLVSRAINPKTPYIVVSPNALKDEKTVEEEIVNKLPWNGYNTKTGEIVGKIYPATVFIDEIHGVSLKGQEILYTMMEDWTFLSKKKKRRTTRIPQFTLIGATTMEGMLSKPMRDRFKMICRFTTYSPEESIAITKLHADRKGLEITKEAAFQIAKRGRGIPRIMVRYLDWISDYLFVSRSASPEKRTLLDEKAALESFELMQIDEIGLAHADIKILKALAEAGRPVGVDTLVIVSSETAKTIQGALEPYLIQCGLIERTPSGRVITETGMEYLEKSGELETRRYYISEEDGDSNGE